MKKCPLCNETLSLDAFAMRPHPERYRNEASKRQSYCKPCARAYYRNSDASKWSRRAANINRHYGGKRLTAAEVRTLGLPVGACYLCGDELEGTPAELDHVQPRNAGGVVSMDNLRWVHRACNRIKHDLPLSALRVHLVKMLAQSW